VGLKRKKELTTAGNNAKGDSAQESSRIEKEEIVARREVSRRNSRGGGVRTLPAQRIAHSNTRRKPLDKHPRKGNSTTGGRGEEATKVKTSTSRGKEGVPGSSYHWSKGEGRREQSS